MLTKGTTGFDHVGRDKTTVMGIPLITSYEEVTRRVVILSLLYLIPAICILQPVIFDTDIWWHLQAGNWMVEHGTLPATDPFSAYGEGKPWVAYSWLFEVGMYGLVQAFGEVGIILYTLVAVWLIMMVLHRIIATRISNFVFICGLMAGSIITLSKMFTPRPWLLTILFFAMTLEVVLLIREGKASRWMWLLPLVYVLWANVHIQFIYGLGLLALACIAPVMDRVAQPVIRTRPVMAWGSPGWKKLVGLTVLCVLATLVTPYHIHLYRVVVELSAQTGMWEYTQEMHAPTFRMAADWAMLGFFSLVLVQLGRGTYWSLFEVLLVVAAGISAFRGQRDVWFFALAGLVIFLPQITEEKRRQWATIPRSGLAPICLLVVAGSAGILGWRDFSEAKIYENTAKVFPAEAVAFMGKQGYHGPLYNHFDWGGYLIWRLPHLKVSMDGRANIYGDERIKQAFLTWDGNPHWTEDSELNKAAVVIARKDMALAALLRLDPRFKVAYQDEIAVVFIRALQDRDQSNAPASEGSPSDPLIVDLALTR